MSKKIPTGWSCFTPCNWRVVTTTPEGYCRLQVGKVCLQVVFVFDVVEQTYHLLSNWNMVSNFIFVIVRAVIELLLMKSLKTRVSVQVKWQSRWVIEIPLVTPHRGSNAPLSATTAVTTVTLTVIQRVIPKRDNVGIHLHWKRNVSNPRTCSFIIPTHLVASSSLELETKLVLISFMLYHEMTSINAS